MATVHLIHGLLGRPDHLRHVQAMLAELIQYADAHSFYSRDAFVDRPSLAAAD